jgi:colanic acid/amylovoran biosynthesis glycosyltransferase
VRILYVLSQYPKLTETFVLEEIDLMHGLGHEVVACSFRPRTPTEAAALEELPFWIAPTRVAPRSARMALRTLVGRPPAGSRAPAPAAPLAERLLERLAFALGAWAGEVARDLRADYLHAHFASGAASAAWAAARASGRPFGFTAHAQDIFIRANPWLAAKALAAALPVTISEFHRRFLIDRLGAAAGGRFETIRCGVDLRVFAPSGAPPTHDVTAVGRLVEKKGFDVLVRALARLPEPRPSCRIVGDGPERVALERLVRELGLAGSVRFLGALPHPRVRAEIDRGRLFVLPCRIAGNGDRDGVPVALMEALALGKAAVSSRVAGVPELVLDGRSGVLTEVDRPDQVAAAIARLLGQPDLARRLGEAGRAHVAAHYDARKNTARLAERIAAVVRSPAS